MPAQTLGRRARGVERARLGPAGRDRDRELSPAHASAALCGRCRGALCPPRREAPAVNGGPCDAGRAPRASACFVCVVLSGLARRVEKRVWPRCAVRVKAPVTSALHSRTGAPRASPGPAGRVRGRRPARVHRPPALPPGPHRVLSAPRDTPHRGVPVACSDLPPGRGGT